MKRYIDADKMIKDTKAMKRFVAEAISCEGIIKYINDHIVLEVDLIPKRHGLWEKVSNKSPRYCCTNCNHLFSNKSYKYCPNCGAKMEVKQ